MTHDRDMGDARGVGLSRPRSGPSRVSGLGGLGGSRRATFREFSGVRAPLGPPVGLGGGSGDSGPLSRPPRFHGAEGARRGLECRPSRPAWAPNEGRTGGGGASVSLDSPRSGVAVGGRAWVVRLARLGRPSGRSTLGGREVAVSPDSLSGARPPERLGGLEASASLDSPAWSRGGGWRPPAPLARLARLAPRTSTSHLVLAHGTLTPLLSRSGVQRVSF